jgi:YD repeat-containing protein
MPSKMRHGVLISLMVISFNTSYAETVNYGYDELNRLIQVTYEDGRGVTYIYDASGNRITLTQNVDTVPPTGTITINSGAAVTNNPSVTLTLTCSDNVGCSQMQFSNDNVTYSTPETYGPTKSWTLSPGDGAKTVYAKFKDAAGNWSASYSDTIDLDSYTKSLLHMNGTDGSTTFADSATGGTHTWTPSGNAQIDTAQSKFGGASGYFDGDGDYISTPDSSDFDFGGGNFTVDFWLRMIRINAFHHVIAFYGSEWSNGNYQWYFEVDENGGSKRWKLQAAVYDSSGHVLVSNSALSDQTWYHVALVRNGSEVALYINGQKQSSTYNIGSNSLIDPAGTSYAKIGDATWTTYHYYYKGWIDEFRISKGIARWTSNFTPPAEEY